MKRWKKVNKFLPTVLTIIAILLTSAGVIAYGRGYRIRKNNTDTGMLTATGLLSATSDPVGAQVFVDGTLKAATNNSSIYLDPGKHTIKISKEGYLPWQKDIRIDREVVSRADAFLFPVSPSLSPLTSTGISEPTLSPDGTKVAYIIVKSDRLQESKNAGLWVYDLGDRPLGLNRDARQIIMWTPTFDLTHATLRWSPNSEQILVGVPGETRLYSVAKPNEPQLVTGRVASLLSDWALEEKTKQIQQLAAFKKDVVEFASASAKIIAFSPDETKFIYEATASATLPPIITPPLIGTNTTVEDRSVKPGKIYVYDSKEDKNYFLFTKEEVFPSPTPSPTVRQTRTLKPTPTPVPSELDLVHGKTVYPFEWFPTNRHIVLLLPGKIDILEYDRTNWITVYSGPFVDTFAAPWPGGSRIIIVTNLNPGASPVPNLYTVNLR